MRTVVQASLFALLCGLVLAAAPRDDVRIDLARATWQRGATGSGQAQVLKAGLVRLPFDGMGVRWGTVFQMDGAGQARLRLDYQPGPAGMLFEILLDGTPLTPARDAWRPTSRRVTLDLGSVWLGKGSHLVEFVCRERVQQARLQLRVLDILRLPRP